MSRITMRDYNSYRVRRALASLGVAGREVTLACGSMVKVVKKASVYRGGECFYNDIETSLPYIETVTSYYVYGRELFGGRSAHHGESRSSTSEYQSTE